MMGQNASQTCGYKRLRSKANLQQPRLKQNVVDAEELVTRLSPRGDLGILTKKSKTNGKKVNEKKKYTARAAWIPKD